MENRLIDIAEKKFLSYGIRSVSMDDIAKELGISKKTIYNYFEDKDALVLKVTQKMLSNKTDQITLSQKNAKNAIDEIIINTEMMRDILENLNPVILYDMQKYHPKAWEEYLKFNELLKEAIKRNLLVGIEQGYYRKDINVDILAILRSEWVNLAFSPSIFPSLKFNIMEVQMESLIHFLRGVVTLNGLEIIEKSLILKK